MEKVSKAQVSFNGLLPTFVKLLQSWTPKKLRTETDYRDDLVRCLRESVPEDARVEAEYRHRGTTMDVWLSWKGVIQNSELAFELKKDLGKKADFDRLVGQIEGLDPSRNNVIVVLIGETDEELLDRLRERYKRFLDGFEGHLGIVVVRPSVLGSSVDQKKKKDDDDDW